MEKEKVLNSPKPVEKKKRNFKKGYLLVIPAFLFYLLFWAYPVIIAFAELFTDLDGGFTFANIAAMATELRFLEALLNTMVFAIVSIILQFVLALLLALLINRKFKGSSIFLFLMMLPMAIPIAAVGIIWETGLTELGWVNSIIESIGLQGLIDSIKAVPGPILWKTATGIKAVLFLVLVDTWTVLPSVMIIILAGLQNLNKEYQEAAMVFGATKRQTVTDIVIPIIKPTIITSLLLRIISGVQVWLIAVLIFDFNKVPFLVERIVYFNNQLTTDPSYDKIAVAYSVLVVTIVMIMATAFLRANKKAERGMSNG